MNRNGHCCPSLLVEIAGPYIGLSGAVWSSRPCISPLSCIIPFLDVRQDPSLQLLQARLIMAIRVGLSQLQSFYANIPADNGVDESQLMFPYPRRYVNVDGQEIAFTYEKFLLDVSHGSIKRGEEESVRQNPIFKAIEVVSRKSVVVKFCRQYGAKVHQLMAEKELAPKLYACQEIGSWYMVVMEYIDGECPHPGKFYPKISEFQGTLEDNGYVHGDLRPDNFLVDKNGSAWVIDFDWAGKAGEVVYPVVLNHGIDWPKGAEIGACISIDHDKHMLRRYFP